VGRDKQREDRVRLGSLFGWIEQLKDPRRAYGKRYSLTSLLTIILLAKLCGKDNPVEIADWAKYQAKITGQNKLRQVKYFAVKKIEGFLEDHVG
jgi:hypothetical protein